MTFKEHPIDTYYAGNVYVTIPIKLILEIIEKHKQKENKK